MASQVNDVIYGVKIGTGANKSIASSAYGECTTASNTAAKVVDMTGFVLVKGVTITVKFTNSNTAISPTLNVNNTGAKPITIYGTTSAGDDEYTSWKDGSIISFTYDGTSFVMNDYTNNDLVFSLHSKTLGVFRNNPTEVYGVRIDFDSSTSTRLGNSVGLTSGSDFDNFTPWQRKRCILEDGGHVLAYYGENGYTETGSLTQAITKNGTTYPIGTEVQVMVEQQPFWYKVVPISLTPNTDSGIGYHTKCAEYYISPSPRSGFKLHPAFYGSARPIYLSAYEGSYYDTALGRIFNDDSDTSTTINSGDKLCSIGNNTKPISGLYKAMTKANFELIAQNRGANWHLETIQVNMLNLLLFAIEYASFNSQNEIGAGVTAITDNSSYNCASLAGSTANLGNASGRATSTISSKGSTQTTETDENKTSISYRGVENIWGNIYNHINGINIHGNGAQAGGQIFVNPTLSGFSEQTMTSPYVAVAVTLPKDDGYIKYFGFDSNYPWLLFPSKTGSGADSAKPIGDYCYKTANLNGYRIARSGGRWVNGAMAGASYWSGSSSAGSRTRDIGGRLIYIPSSS